jgi:hypothetical protein
MRAANRMLTPRLWGQKAAVARNAPSFSPEDLRAALGMFPNQLVR